jgi:phosphatidate cytidylyltransferase
VIGPDLRIRVISGLVMAAAAILSEIAGGWWFALFWIAVFAAVAVEWQRIIGPDAGHWRSIAAGMAAILSGLLFQAGYHLPAYVPLVLAAVFCGWLCAPERSRAVFGLAYAGLPMLAVIWLRSAEPNGLVVIAWLFGIVWSADIAAYFSGRAIGGPKLWPSVSPKKTWSGLIGGTLGGALVATLVLVAFGLTVTIMVVVVALLLALLSAGGDLFESALKRRFGVKDSSNLIPGHGGLMDRVDGFIAVAVGAGLVALIRGGDQGAALISW